MSIRVNDFRWEPGKNDVEYIKLLESSRDEWQKIAQKAIAKLRTLSKAQEPRLLTLKEVQQERTMWLETNNHEWDAMNGVHETVLRTDDDRYDFSDIIVQFVDQDGCDIVCARDRFGIEWRCWSSEPTEEQREAIPWQNI